MESSGFKEALGVLITTKRLSEENGLSAPG